MGNTFFFKLRDTEGNIYPHTFGWGVKDQVNNKTLEELVSEVHTQPGDKVSGLIVFQIPQSATPKSLTYDDNVNIITINL
jgi:Domain of unknown function (DUF4352)